MKKGLRALLLGSSILIGGVGYQVASYATGDEACVRCRGRHLDVVGPGRYVDRQLVARINSEDRVVELVSSLPEDFEPIACEVVKGHALDSMACVLTGRNEVAPFDCACRKATGDCRVPSLDGGMEPAPFGVTLSAGRWDGDCLPKACVEMAGEQGQSWPGDCPEVTP